MFLPSIDLCQEQDKYQQMWFLESSEQMGREGWGYGYLKILVVNKSTEKHQASEFLPSVCNNNDGLKLLLK